MTHVLYGLPHSLYSGKARAYLRKNGIPFVERSPADARFRNDIVPQIGRVIIPVLETGDGAVIQDTADIIDHFESAGVRHSATPPGPRQRAVAHLVDLYAVVTLVRHAMHYRWSYLASQQRFLTHAFAGDTQVMARMQSYLPMLGVTEATIPEIERSLTDLLRILDAHFAQHPYLLGGQASLGDYGLFGPMFAHLGRDPVPLAIMQATAPNVFRRTERMNAPGPDMAEFGDYPAGFAADDAVPDTLLPLLDLMAQEMVGELVDKAAALAAHVAAHDPAEGAPVADRPHHRTIAAVTTRFRGVPFEAGLQPYQFLVWQRLCDEGAADDAVRALFAEHGLLPLLDTRRAARVERRGNIEVWGRIG
ncbi:glutathione S-transferase family protein [uncultured Croceicoccus sp.]|uniref:glutathione S-transferase family protein n=1 Tax=uncultured Croceicoccus sp. TaxID=1295329 RepID=UPI00260ACD76|nr:glutathione S-transferase family protein [uncultured Croceicoccus sp.]